MSTPLRVSPTDLIAWAVSHERTADGCVTARADHPRVVEAAATWGPMFADARAATVDTVNAREAALVAQEDWHRRTAEQLRVGAARYEAMDSQNQSHLRAVPAAIDTEGNVVSGPQEVPYSTYDVEGKLTQSVPGRK